jgi:DNA-binding transcriptional LysR family regulator
MLSRTQIRQFLAVVDTGSFTRAANALFIAQPSLSAGIAELERQLGTRLFVRERRRIRLTNAGNVLLPLARSIERGFHQIEAKVGSMPVPNRPLRLGVLETLPTSWLERVMQAYTGNETIELNEGSQRELQSALVNGSLDLAIMIVEVGQAMPYEEMIQDDYCLALSANHPLASASLIEARQVANETMLARRSCERLSETSRFFTDRGVRPHFALRSANDERVLAMVRAGLGVTVAPRSLGGPGIAMVPIAEFGFFRRLGIVFSDGWAEQERGGHELVQRIYETRPVVGSIFERSPVPN